GGARLGQRRRPGDAFPGVGVALTQPLHFALHPGFIGIGGPADRRNRQQQRRRQARTRYLHHPWSSRVGDEAAAYPHPPPRTPTPPRGARPAQNQKVTAPWRAAAAPRGGETPRPPPVGGPAPMPFRPPPLLPRPPHPGPAVPPPPQGSYIYQPAFCIDKELRY